MRAGLAFTRGAPAHGQAGSALPGTTDARCNRNRFLFQWRTAVTKRRAVEKILPQKSENSAEPLVLRRVHQLVDEQTPILPAIGADKNAVLQSEATRRGWQKLDLRGCSS